MALPECGGGQVYGGKRNCVKLDGKKISKKAASEKFGKEEMDRMIREAKKAFAEDSLQEISWWMGEGMLSITFR
mgnify:FL=1